MKSHVSPRKKRLSLLGAALAIAALTLTGCGLFGSTSDSIDQALNGFSATMTTYNNAGQPIDEIHGASFHITRDDTFDTTNSNGTSSNNSKVLLISLANAHISHVGSCMTIVQDGLTDIASKLPPEFRFSNNKPGTPWLNDIRYRFGQLWGGSARTIMIRSQDGSPVSVFAGNQVQSNATNVPSSTWFRVDGKTLFVYRCDYTVVDTSLLGH